MKRLFVLILLTVLLITPLSGCGLYNLSNFILPDDAEFLALIQELDTPEKICQYMADNFTYKIHLLYVLTPYQLYITQEGDCDDFANFAMFIANYHGYETYLVKISYSNYLYNHCIAIYKENGSYNFSGNQYYYSTTFKNFLDVVEYDGQWTHYLYGYIWFKYKVYDYDRNLIEKGMK